MAHVYVLDPARAKATGGYLCMAIPLPTPTGCITHESIEQHKAQTS
jgi:hypothetical protein